MRVRNVLLLSHTRRLLIRVTFQSTVKFALAASQSRTRTTAMPSSCEDFSPVMDEGVTVVIACGGVPQSGWGELT